MIEGVNMNPLVQLNTYGQSFWYDNIRRRYLLDGTLARLINEDGLRGMTSNPSIFEQAIGGGSDYDEQIARLAETGAKLAAVYEGLVLEDIRLACDLFAPLHTETRGGDGFVSLEVSPHLARDTEGTVDEARRLFAAVDRPNVMIKVPATEEGIPAVRQLISEGVNVNITLMFSMSHYEAVADAYMDGLTVFMKRGGEPARVASVASFFVSRVDTAVDKQLKGLTQAHTDALLGRSAIANSKQVYQRFQELFHGQRFESLRTRGAQVQRLLWASTSTKNPDYADTLYVDNLIGPQTVNTMPPSTIDAFRDHGRVANTLEDGLEEARVVLQRLAELGINLEAIAEDLQEAGVEAFARSFDKLMDTLAHKVRRLAEPS
jgi:transaldolase